jgi:exodeoxyribonuclease-3
VFIKDYILGLSIASWNINSVRLRIEQITQFLAREAPDIIALQEIKCQNHEFPEDAFRALGYEHIHVTGQKSWHGVALASKKPLEILDPPPFCRRSEARVQAVMVDGIELWNFYIPAGGDVPDRDQNDKFDHKLEFYERVTDHLGHRTHEKPLILVGDLNIAPGEFDVWSHKQMLRVVSHTPQELETFAAMMAAGAFHDPFRDAYPDPQKIFSWWSYRAADFRASNRGLRLDHILLNPSVKQQITALSAKIHDDVRAWDKPSDHAPIQVWLDFKS